MSQRPSLKIDSVGKKHRNVFTRLERIKKLQEQSRWRDDTPIYGLPKIKSIKVKVKSTSTKAEGTEAAAAVPGAAGPEKAKIAEKGKAAEKAKPAEKAKAPE